ncbi:MAG: hypothetical protein IT548_12515 [Alphaproteobacteria bacterium]|nr:hypothetical protein [Alphaproteobacteria bacterium]
MDQANSSSITGPSIVSLAVTAMALVFLGNGEMGFVPALQVTHYAYALYALILVMMALWIEALIPRFRAPRDEESGRAPLGLAISPGLPLRGQWWMWRFWIGGLILAALTALLLAVTAALGRRGVEVPLDVLELGLAGLAWPAACLLVLSALVRHNLILAKSA